jgi:hypothetical protein
MSVATLRHLTPQGIADQLALPDAEAVYAWLRSGELVGINVGRGSKKPRWRVSPEDFERFLERRKTGERPKASRVKVQPAEHTRFFPET